MGREYRIPDEPRPGGLSHLTVNPVFPLLSMMLGGSLIGLPWFILNSRAMGSPYSRREIVIALLTPIVAFGVLLLCVSGGILLGIPNRALHYYLVLMIGTKLAGAYWIFTLQNRAFGIYQYSGAPVRNGLGILMAATFAKFYFLPEIGEISPYLNFLVL